MKKLNINPSTNAPEVVFNTSKNHLTIAGECCPENPKSFFLPLQQWASSLVSDPVNELKVKVELSSLCNSSKRELLLFFQTLKAVKIDGGKISVTWIVGDSLNIQNVGENLDYLSGLKFKFQKAVVQELATTEELVA